MRIFRLFFLPVFLLTGCFRFGLDTLHEVEFTGTEFQKELARSYMKFAESEAAQYDWSSAQYFSGKGLAAAKGHDLEPEEVKDWRIPKTTRHALEEARELLIRTVTDNVKKSEPQTAARAFFLYDCWMEQQEENWQTEHIDACRNQFFETLDYLSVAAETIVPQEAADDQIKSEVMVDPELIEPVEKTDKLASPLGPVKKTNAEESSYIVMFDYDSVAINKEGKVVIDDVAEELEEYTDALVVLNGHTDRAGNAKYNMVLSKMRAIAVKSALIEKGVKDSAIEVNAFGENQPRVSTPDGRKERANRIVEVIIK